MQFPVGDFFIFFFFFIFHSFSFIDSSFLHFYSFFSVLLVFASSFLHLKKITTPTDISLLLWREGVGFALKVVDLILQGIQLSTHLVKVCVELFAVRNKALLPCSEATLLLLHLLSELLPHLLLLLLHFVIEILLEPMNTG